MSQPYVSGIQRTEVIGSKAKNAAAANLSDAANLTNGLTSGLYVGGAGNVVVTLENMADGASITLTALAVGVVHPLAVKRVWATGTTATGILAMYS